MNQNAKFTIIFVAGLLVGFFAGREYLKFEIRSETKHVVGEIKDIFTKSFGPKEPNPGNFDQKAVRAKRDTLDYAAEFITLSDIEASYRESTILGTLPHVRGNIKNSGSRSIKGLVVTVYYLDKEGKVFFEDNHPSGSLKPNYSTTISFLTENLPKGWVEGRVNVKVTELEFADE